MEGFMILDFFNLKPQNIIATFDQPTPTPTP